MDQLRILTQACLLLNAAETGELVLQDPPSRSRTDTSKSNNKIDKARLEYLLIATDGAASSLPSSRSLPSGSGSASSSTADDYQRHHHHSDSEHLGDSAAAAYDTPQTAFQKCRNRECGNPRGQPSKPRSQYCSSRCQFREQNLRQGRVKNIRRSTSGPPIATSNSKTDIAHSAFSQSKASLSTRRHASSSTIHTSPRLMHDALLYTTSHESHSGSPVSSYQPYPTEHDSYYVSSSHHTPSSSSPPQSQHHYQHQHQHQHQLQQQPLQHSSRSMLTLSSVRLPFPAPVPASPPSPTHGHASHSPSSSPPYRGATTAFSAYVGQPPRYYADSIPASPRLAMPSQSHHHPSTRQHTRSQLYAGNSVPTVLPSIICPSDM